MKIGIIGAGKVGVALAYSFRQRGFSVVAVSSRRAESLEAAKRYLGPDPVYTIDNKEVALLADLVAVTTQDREIGNVAREVSELGDVLKGKTFFHTSGAHPALELSPLDGDGCSLGSFHPLQTFPDVDAGIAALPETYIFIEGDEEARTTLETLARSVGFDSVAIDSKNKVLYHLSAVFVCNLLTALLFSGEAIMERAEIDLKPFYPIIRATLKNIESKGPLASLTGPIVRGDAGTVASHLRAMEGMELHERVYKTLSLVAVEMAHQRQTLTEEQREALISLLTTTKTTIKG
jgi:predicted short-subunit dehydrogenase-like oxidoreductase (DUF2520 family)